MRDQKNYLPFSIFSCTKYYLLFIQLSHSSNNHAPVNLDHAELNEWVGLHLKTTVTLTNKFAFDVTVKWNEESMDPVLHGVMTPGQRTEVVRMRL